MSLTLQDVITAVRFRHPAFDKRMVPDAALASFYTGEQRRLVTRGLQRDRQFLAQQLPIALALDDANAPGTAGVETAGGRPAAIAAAGSVSAVNRPVGVGVQVLTTSDDVVTLVSDTVVASATATTLTGMGVSWTTNAYADATVVIVAGKGALQPPRTIASNTSETLTVTDAWAITPDDTSMFAIVQAVNVASDTFGVVTDLPALSTAQGYLVRLDATGQPFVDTTKPLSVSLAQGVPLPAYHSVLGATVRSAQDPTDTGRLTLIAFADRFAPSAWPAAYVLNNALYLCGTADDWRDIASIEVTYTPVPPAFTARTDLFLLPDVAQSVLVARGAEFCALRLVGAPGVPTIPVPLLTREAAEAESAFVDSLGLTRRARVGRIREVC